MQFAKKLTEASSSSTLYRQFIICFDNANSVLTIHPCKQVEPIEENVPLRSVIEFLEMYTLGLC